MTVGVGVLCSGSGTNLGALLAADRQGQLAPAAVKLVLCNKPGVGAIAKADAAGVPVRLLPHGDYPTREAYDDALVAELKRAGCELVALAGFMRLVTARLLDAFPGRVLNVHPSLLPAFPGLHAQRQALEHGVKVAGATVHFVDEGLDRGPIIVQRAVPVLDGDDEAALSQRILTVEHELYPRAVRLVASGTLRLQGRRVLGTE